MKNFVRLSLALITLSLPPLAQADDDDGPPITGKDGYTLFNPTPADKMREFETDRPDRSEGPYTVDAGHFQYESSVGAYSRHRTLVNGVDTTSHTTTVNDMELRLGLLNDLDLDVEIPTYNWQSTKVAGSPSTVTRGMGDMTIEAKWNFLGNDGGPLALGLIPYVKAPTGPGGIGDGKLEEGLIFPVAIDLPSDFDLGISFEAARMKNDDTPGFHTDFNTALTLDHPLTRKLSGYVEFYAGARGGETSGWEATADVGVEYLLTDAVQVDTGCNFGLTPLADDFATFVGLSFRL